MCRVLDQRDQGRGKSKGGKIGKGKACRGWAEEGHPVIKGLALGRPGNCVSLGKSSYLSE